MTLLNPRGLLLAAALVFVGCAHRELTGDDHRAAAAADLQAAEAQKAQYDPDATAMTLSPRPPPSALDPVPAPTFYNPSQAHLVEADRRMASAFRHLDAARRLESFENFECQGISAAERMSCPVIAPHLDRVEEGSRGIVLHLKSSEKAKTLSTQMRCHLAFSKANNFEKAPCPLYMKGVDIVLVDEKAIEVTSADANVARAVREEARKMFGEAPASVSTR